MTAGEAHNVTLMCSYSYKAWYYPQSEYKTSEASSRIPVSRGQV